MSSFLRYSLTSSGSNADSSLEGIKGYSDLDVALVQQPNRWYRFFAADTSAPNGTTVIAPADILPANPGRWILQGPPGPGGPNPRVPVRIGSTEPEAFDYVISSYGDLYEATGGPVADVFRLSGSYAITTSIDLGTEGISFDTNSRVVGMTPGDGFTTSFGSPLVTIPAGVSVVLEGLTLQNDAGPGVENSGTLDILRCDVTTTAAFYPMRAMAGIWRGFDNRYNGPAYFAGRCDAGDWTEFVSFFTSMFTGIDIRNTVNDVLLNRCQVVGGQNGIRSRGVRNTFIDCDISVGTDSSAAIACLETENLLVQGGTLRSDVAGTDRSGIWFAGTGVQGSVVMSDVTMELLEWGVRNTATSLMDNFTLANSVLKANVNVGVQWSNGIFPNNALILSATGFLGATPFSGFSETTPRANIKQCYGAGGLLAETPIV